MPRSCGMKLFVNMCFLVDILCSFYIHVNLGSAITSVFCFDSHLTKYLFFLLGYVKPTSWQKLSKKKMQNYVKLLEYPSILLKEAAWILRDMLRKQQLVQQQQQQNKRNNHVHNPNTPLWGLLVHHLQIQGSSVLTRRGSAKLQRG